MLCYLSMYVCNTCIRIKHKDTIDFIDYINLHVSIKLFLRFIKRFENTDSNQIRAIPDDLKVSIGHRLCKLNFRTNLISSFSSFLNNVHSDFLNVFTRFLTLYM